MAPTTKHITLDGSGAGAVHVPPSYYLGGNVDGGGNVTNDGDNLGTALLTRATAKVVAGEVDVSGGTPAGTALLYFDC